MRFDQVKNFFAIENKSFRQEKKNELRRNINIEEFRSDGLI